MHCHALSRTSQGAGRIPREHKKIITVDRLLGGRAKARGPPMGERVSTMSACVSRRTTLARGAPTRHPVEMRELRRVGEPGEVPAEVGALETVENVVRWGLAQRPSWEVAGVVVQDEYCHDVIVRGPGAVFACFDTT